MRHCHDRFLSQNWISPREPSLISGTALRHPHSQLGPRKQLIPRTFLIRHQLRPAPHLDPPALGSREAGQRRPLPKHAAVSRRMAQDRTEAGQAHQGLLGVCQGFVQRAAIDGSTTDSMAGHVLQEVRHKAQRGTQGNAVVEALVTALDAALPACPERGPMAWRGGCAAAPSII